MRHHELRIIAHALTDLRRRRAHRLRESKAPAPIVPVVGRKSATVRGDLNRVVGYGR